MGLASGLGYLDDINNGKTEHFAYDQICFHIQLPVDKLLSGEEFVGMKLTGFVKILFEREQHEGCV